MANGHYYVGTYQQYAGQIRPDCDIGLASLAKCDRVLVDDFIR